MYEVHIKGEATERCPYLHREEGVDPSTIAIVTDEDKQSKTNSPCVVEYAIHQGRVVSMPGAIETVQGGGAKDECKGPHEEVRSKLEEPIEWNSDSFKQKVAKHESNKIRLDAMIRFDVEEILRSNSDIASVVVCYSQIFRSAIVWNTEAVRADPYLRDQYSTLSFLVDRGIRQTLHQQKDCRPIYL